MRPRRTAGLTSPPAPRRDLIFARLITYRTRLPVPHAAAAAVAALGCGVGAAVTAVTAGAGLTTRATCGVTTASAVVHLTAFAGAAVAAGSRCGRCRTV